MSFSRLNLRPYPRMSTLSVMTQKPAVADVSAAAAVYDGGNVDGGGSDDDTDEHSGTVGGRFSDILALLRLLVQSKAIKTKTPSRIRQIAQIKTYNHGSDEIPVLDTITLLRRGVTDESIIVLVDW